MLIADIPKVQKFNYNHKTFLKPVPSSKIAVMNKVITAYYFL